MSIPPHLNFVKENKENHDYIDDLKLLKMFETKTFSIWIYSIPISKRGITPEHLCQTSQNKCHAHLIFISFMYSNFHVDALTTLE